MRVIAPLPFIFLLLNVVQLQSIQDPSLQSEKSQKSQLENVNLLQQPEQEARLHVSQPQTVIIHKSRIPEADLIFLTFKTITGHVQAFLTTPTGGQLQIEEGINKLNLAQIAVILGHSLDNLAVLVVPTMESEVMIKLGQPRHSIQVAQLNKQFELSLQTHSMHGRVYKVESTHDYVLTFTRLEGYPAISVIQCLNLTHFQCIYAPALIPANERQGKWAKIEGNQTKREVLFRVQRMMAQQEEYQGRKCEYCQTYVLIQGFEGLIDLQMRVSEPNTAIRLQESEIRRENLPTGYTKDYQVGFQPYEAGLISLKVFEGQVHARVHDQANGWQYEASSKSGVIPIEIPKTSSGDGSRQVHLLVTALSKDASYSVMFSSGDYEFYLKDGETASHQIKANETASYFYLNERLEDQSIYLSLKIDEPTAVSKLKMHIFYFDLIKDVAGVSIEGVQEVKHEYIYSKPILELEGVRSMVFQVPGNYPKLAFTFQNGWERTVSIDLAINDEQIVFLPLSHNMPLQVDKDGSVNLLVKNNEEGFIELVIKKCDDSNPTFAYSLSPSDFLNQIYDYESMAESERISTKSIKVEKGKGLYISVSGDGMSNSFLQITARYMELGRKKLEVAKLQKGDHGVIKYQLLTDSKAEITFTGLQCAMECRDSTVYECVWSTSRAEMYRQLICPSSFIITAGGNNTEHTGSFEIGIKPAHSDNQVSFKHILTDNILYMNVKATHVTSKTQFYYKEIQIVTIEGQIGRLSQDFKQKIVVAILCIGLLLYWLLSCPARRGYQPIQNQQGDPFKRNRSQRKDFKDDDPQNRSHKSIQKQGSRDSIEKESGQKTGILA